MTNTGRLTGLCLENHKIIEKDRAGVEYKPEEILCDDYINLMLYPEAAQELNRTFIEKLSKPINLIVPDGTWHQTRKIFRSEKLLHSIKRVTLPTENPNFYFLRKPQKEFYFSTFEAISRALEIIETKEVCIKLKTILDEMAIRLLKRNGKINQQNISQK
jgi:DTW domain-containing protein